MSQPQEWPSYTSPPEAPVTSYQGDPIASAPPAVDDQGIADFTPDRPRPRFRVGDDIFEGKVDVPTLTLMEYSSRVSDNPTDEEGIESTLAMIRILLKKDSAERFIERLRDDENPIGPATFQKVIPYLMEAYGMRPLEQPSESADGSPNPDTGPNSTENSAPTA